MSDNLTIAVDVDEVCADLLGAWLSTYNNTFGTAFIPEDIVGWDLSKTVKPESKESLYNIIKNPHIYQRILPIPYARHAVRELRAMGHRVVFVTTCVFGTESAKFNWLVNYEFLGKGDAKDFIAVTDKSLVRADILFDDKPANVANFKGTGVLVRCPHNRDEVFPYAVDSLKDAPRWVLLDYPNSRPGPYDIP